MLAKEEASHGPFATWLHQHFVDRGDLEKQLRILSTDITNRLTKSMAIHRLNLGSTVVFPAGCGALNEDVSLLRYNFISFQARNKHEKFGNYFLII